MERCPSGLRSWSWKPVTQQCAVGSNPTLSASTPWRYIPNQSATAVNMCFGLDNNLTSLLLLPSSPRKKQESKRFILTSYRCTAPCTPPTDGWLNQIVQIDAVGRPVGWHLLANFVHMTTGTGTLCSVYSGVGGYAKAYPPCAFLVDYSTDYFYLQLLFYIISQSYAENTQIF